MTRRGSLRDLGRLLLGHSRRYRHRRLQEVAASALREPGGERAWVVSVVNVTLRGRRFLRSSLRLAPRRLRTRLAFRRAAIRDFAGRQRVLSLLCPTRQRISQVIALLTSISQTAAVPGRVEVLFYVDSDDPQLEQYRALLADGGGRFGDLARCVLLVDEPVGVPAAWNELAAAAAGDLLLMANDDQRYVDYGWDVRLDTQVTELTRTLGDEVACLFFDGGQYPEGGHDFPIVTRRWYQTLGYFTPTMFSQWEVETWVFDIAERLGRLFPVPGVFVEHLHYQDYKAPFDATYQRHRMTTQKSLTDHALFLRTAGQREADAAKLRAVIDAASAGRDTATGDTEAATGDTEAATSGTEAAAGEPDTAGFWFAGYLADQQERAAAEVSAWLAAQAPDGADGADGAAAAGPADRVSLYAAGAWTPQAWRSFPVITDIMAAVPEATLPDHSAVDLTVLRPGPAQAQALADASEPGSVDVLWGIAVPDGTSLETAGRRRVWAAGECVAARGRLAVTLPEDNRAPLVAVWFTVAREPAPAGASGRRAGGRDA